MNSGEKVRVSYKRNSPKARLGKTKKTLLIIIAVIVGFSIITFSVDGTLADNNRTPIFSIPYAHMSDGGSVCYLGLGYQIVKWEILADNRQGYNVGVEKHFLSGIDLFPPKANIPLAFEKS